MPRGRQLGLLGGVGPNGGGGGRRGREGPLGTGVAGLGEALDPAALALRGAAAGGEGAGAAGRDGGRNGNENGNGDGDGYGDGDGWAAAPEGVEVEHLLGEEAVAVAGRQGARVAATRH